MNIPTITMPATDALAKLQTYRQALHAKADAKYEAIAAGYAALAKGTPLVDLAAVFATAPVDEQGRPRLAIARADTHAVSVSTDASAYVFNSHKQGPQGWVASGIGSRARRIPVLGLVHKTWNENYSLVPMVPPDVRGQRSLGKHFVLWEVERWVRERELFPQRDPYLLKPIGGLLYAVVGEWELTDLERSILSQFV